LNRPLHSRSIARLGGPALAVNFALSAAKARSRSSARDTRRELKQAALGWRERRENDLKQMGVVIPLSDWLGHNQGPPILDPTLLLERQWRAARKAAFAPPDAETGRRWAEKAARLNLTYSEYRLELLERGRHPTDEEARRIVKARPASAGLTDV
jgi:hypothetical protein